MIQTSHQVESEKNNKLDKSKNKYKDIQITRTRICDEFSSLTQILLLATPIITCIANLIFTGFKLPLSWFLLVFSSSYSWVRIEFFIWENLVQIISNVLEFFPFLKLQRRYLHFTYLYLHVDSFKMDPDSWFHVRCYDCKNLTSNYLLLTARYSPHCSAAHECNIQINVC